MSKLVKTFRVLALCLMPLTLCASVAFATDVYPTPAWPADATVEALDGTTDSLTGLPFVPTGTKRSSTPPAQVQIDRMFDRMFDILGTDNQLRVVKVDSTHIGVYPGDYVLGGAMVHFAGDTSEAVTTTADTYYVYLNSSNALTIVTDATGWPADVATFVPLAEVTMASSVISSIKDARGWAKVQIGGSGGSVEGLNKYGTTETTWIIGDDTVADGSRYVLFERGDPVSHAAITFDAVGPIFWFESETETSTLSAIKSLYHESTIATGNPPLVVASTTKVTNLNCDLVDGLTFAAPAEAYGLAYASSTSAVAFSEAPDDGEVLVGVSGGPNWRAPGTDSGVQAYDADLDAIAALSSSQGMVARTGAGAFAVRTITAGAGISVTNGEGGSGNPTIAISATTNHAVQVGNASGSLTSLSVGATNTVLVGNSGANPEFRQIVNADIHASANIEVTKLVPGTSGMFLKTDDTGSPAWIGAWESMNVTGATGGYPGGFTSGEANKLWHNTGTTAKVELTLDYAAAGVEQWFVVMDADGMKISAKGGDIIRDGTTDSAAAGYIQSTEIGACIHIIAVNSTYWVVLSKRGTWTVDS